MYSILGGYRTKGLGPGLDNKETFFFPQRHRVNFASLSVCDVLFYLRFDQIRSYSRLSDHQCPVCPGLRTLFHAPAFRPMALVSHNTERKLSCAPLVQNNLDIKPGDHGGHPIHCTAHHNKERRNNIIQWMFWCCLDIWSDWRSLQYTWRNQRKWKWIDKETDFKRETCVCSYFLETRFILPSLCLLVVFRLLFLLASVACLIMVFICHLSRLGEERKV